MFRPEGRGTFSTPCFALKGEILFFAPPKKSTQKKGDPGGLPASRVPCASRANRRSRNSLRSNRARACSGLHCDARLRQTGGGESKPKIKTCHPGPVCTHRVPQPARDQARTLFERIEHREIASCARPRAGEERMGKAAKRPCTLRPMSAPECHSLWVLSLGQARESTSPFRAKLDDKKNTSPERVKPVD